jgi:hypothetical protein
MWLANDKGRLFCVAEYPNRRSADSTAPHTIEGWSRNYGANRSQCSCPLTTIKIKTACSRIPLQTIPDLDMITAKSHWLLSRGGVARLRMVLQRPLLADLGTR